MSQRVYTFGKGTAQGRADMKNLLGGKGANLAEMSNLGIPVPAGFTITTDVCNEYYRLNANYPDGLEKEVTDGLHHIEKAMGMDFGSSSNPLLLSVRSGARVSMPGMMDTVLNLGLNDTTVEGLITKTGNPRFAWDAYRRFVQMYGDVVLGLKPENKNDIDPFEAIIESVKKDKKIETDIDLETEDLIKLVTDFKSLIKKRTGQEFPEDPMTQLWGAIGAVFGSWNNERAILYRKMNGIDDSWGTAVTVMSMVFGNMGSTSATGVAFTRDPSTGEKRFFGEFLINAQGEDVVAGTRTPQEITKKSSINWARDRGIDEETRKTTYPSLEEAMPVAYSELEKTYQSLEKHYRDMQDIEFTIQEGKLWLLQTRNGKRTANASVRIAVEMVKEGLIDRKTALLRVSPESLDQLLHPAFDPEAEKNVITRGLPASPGAATGRIVFHADDAFDWKARGEEVILVRIETSPEDLKGMNAAKGILTQRGGMTSHAAVVARGMGKCCVSGAGALEIHYNEKEMRIGDHVFKEGDYISLDGGTGEVMEGRVPTVEAKLSGNFGTLMQWVEEVDTLGVRTNADTPEDAEKARSFGAQGIGLCRTEHMFFTGHRITAVREMILADSLEGRKAALEKLLPMQKSDFYGILKAMKGLPVTIRLLDPPLHEFAPHDETSQKEVADDLGVSLEKIHEAVEYLAEVNPMLGHRGCRLGITYPEITEMQTRAVYEAACQLKSEGIDARPEIMVPLVGDVRELKAQKDVITRTAKEIIEKSGQDVELKIGTMIEVPRAALMADEIALEADFFSFGTNDLTQMTFGFSRDDSGRFLPEYIDQNILPADPFAVLDQRGVGQLVAIACERGRKSKPDLHIGICGEHGGEPSSIDFCYRTGLDYVSCSPFRVPIARLAAAHAALRSME